MTFAVVPGATGNTSVAMIATTATDTENGVEYNFICTAGGGNDSGWQIGTYYEDTGLSAATQYTYTVTARDTSSNQNETAASAPASATTSDGTNIVLPANGGLLESFTSEYSTGWGAAAALTNGSTTDVGWCSEVNPSSPQEFVYSFQNGDDATLDVAAIHTGDGEGGIYLSKDVEVWTSANGVDFTLAGSATLPNEQYRAIGIDLGGVTAKKVKLSITSGYRTDYWETAEFQVYGNIGGGEPDTDPPTPNPATFASAPSAVSSSEITMTATTGTDATGPVQYFFDETSGNPGGTDSGWVTNPVYNDTGLNASTQYTYTVQMRDSASTPNVGTVSSPASATTPGGCTPTDMHIESVVCSEVSCGGPNRNGRATVTIYDDCGDPVSGALVDVTFTGDISETVYDVATNSSGVAVITSTSCVKRPSFTATVIDVTDTLPYDSNDDVTDNCSG